jgi:hypothetical protein
MNNLLSQQVAATLISTISQFLSSYVVHRLFKHSWSLEDKESEVSWPLVSRSILLFHFFFFLLSLSLVFPSFSAL